MPSAIDIFIGYKFIKQLSTPWKNWDAYKLGLIDDKGVRIRKTKTPEEKKAYPTWKVLVRNMKRIIDKVPFGKSRIGSFAASLFFLKEELHVEDISVLEDEFNKYIDNAQILVESESIDEKINTIPKGRYILESGKVLFLNDTESFTEVLDVPLFKAIDRVSKKEYIVAHSELTKF